MGKTTHRRWSLAVAVLGLASCLGFGCAGSFGAGSDYDYFAPPAADDAWSHKIEAWQARQRADRGEAASSAPAPVGASGAERLVPENGPDGLRAKYDAFRSETRREIARDLAQWIQQQARKHYTADGPVDHWATLEETFRGNGDDCDGLELLVYRLLRDLGFGNDEIFRAIVFRKSDLQHHMVTLWFEDPDDPWVIDPTGAMTSGMPRMSDIPGWTPLKIFTEDGHYTVHARAAR
jgi:hypothetical protein